MCGAGCLPPANLKDLNYSELIPIMIKAIREQQAEINA